MRINENEFLPFDLIISNGLKLIGFNLLVAD